MPGRSRTLSEAGARSETGAAGRASGPIAGPGAETRSVVGARPLARARGAELPRRPRGPAVIRLPLAPRGARSVSLPAGRPALEIRPGARAEAAGARTTRPLREAALSRAGEAALSRAGAEAGAVPTGAGPAGAETTRARAGEAARPRAGAKAGPVAAGSRPAGAHTPRPVERTRAFESASLRPVAAGARPAGAHAALADAARSRPLAAGLAPAGVVVPRLMSMVRQVSFHSCGSAAEDGGRCIGRARSRRGLLSAAPALAVARVFYEDPPVRQDGPESV